MRHPCHLCRSVDTTELFREVYNRQTYTVVHCNACHVYQTVERHHAASPDYVRLARDEIRDDLIWCQGRHKEPAFKQWSAGLEKHAMAGDRWRLLDVGCGTGGFLEYCRPLGFELHGFDASPAQVAYARQSFASVERALTVSDYVRQRDLAGLPFDLVTLWDVLEHIASPLALLHDIHQHLARSGLLFLSVPNGGAIWWKMKLKKLMKKPISDAWIPWEHLFYYSSDTLAKCLEALGFEILEIGAVRCYPRRLSTFEILRRLGFRALSLRPALSPQIYVWARRSTTPPGAGM